MHPSFCPHCGYDLAVAAPVKIGGALFDPSRGFFFDGKAVALTGGESIVIEALMRARGAIVSRQALMGRLDSDGVDRIADTHIKRIRIKLRRIGCDMIRTHYCLGYSWGSTLSGKLPHATNTNARRCGARPFNHGRGE